MHWEKQAKIAGAHVVGDAWLIIPKAPMDSHTRPSRRSWVVRAAAAGEEGPRFAPTSRLQEEDSARAPSSHQPLRHQKHQQAKANDNQRHLPDIRLTTTEERRGFILQYPSNNIGRLGSWHPPNILGSNCRREFLINGTPTDRLWRQSSAYLRNNNFSGQLGHALVKQSVFDEDIQHASRDWKANKPNRRTRDG